MIGKSLETGSAWVAAKSSGVKEGRIGNDANEHRSDINILKLDSGDCCNLCEYTKN